MCRDVFSIDFSFLQKESDSNQLTISVFGVHYDVVSGAVTLND